MLKYFRSLVVKPSAHEIAVRDLQEARRRLIQSHASAEYHAKMVEYYEGLVERLEGYIGYER